MMLAEQLTGDMLLCSLLSEILYQPPARERCETLFAEGVFSEAPIGEDLLEVQRGLALLRAWGDEVWAKDSAAAFEQLESDYMRLFVGPGKVIAPPWESVYFNDENLLFQEQTLQVRNWYRRYGLGIERLHQEPDDHIGLELSFIAQLSARGLQALAAQDTDAVQRLLNDRAKFASRHVLTWAPKWCSLVDEGARTDFYRGAAWLVVGACRAVAQVEKRAAELSG